MTAQASQLLFFVCCAISELSLDQNRTLAKTPPPFHTKIKRVWGKGGKKRGGEGKAKQHKQPRDRRQQGEKTAPDGASKTRAPRRDGNSQAPTDALALYPLEQEHRLPVGCLPPRADRPTSDRARTERLPFFRRLTGWQGSASAFLESRLRGRRKVGGRRTDRERIAIRSDLPADRLVPTRVTARRDFFVTSSSCEGVVSCLTLQVSNPRGHRAP